MHSLMCVSVVVCVARKPRPCLSYNRRRDRINSVLLRSYYKGGGGVSADPSKKKIVIFSVSVCKAYLCLHDGASFLFSCLSQKKRTTGQWFFTRVSRKKAQLQNSTIFLLAFTRLYRKKITRLYNLFALAFTGPFPLSKAGKAQS